MRVWLQNPRHQLSLMLSLLPLLLVIAYTYTYRTRFLEIDQWWVSIPTAMAAKSDMLTWEQLTHPTITGHRLLFTHLQTAFLTKTIGWQVEAEAALNVILAVINFGLLIALFWRYCHARLWLALVPFSALMFSVFQSINWHLGFETCWHFVNLFLLLMLLALTTERYPLLAFGGAVICAVAASFAMAHGVLLWGVGAGVIFLHGWRGRLFYLVIWVIIGAVLIRDYQHALAALELNNNEWSSLELYSPFKLIEFTLIYLGTPFSGLNPQLAGVVGVIGIALFMFSISTFWRQNKQIKPLAAWLGLAVFALANGVLIATARLDLPEGMAVTATYGRYTTTSIFLWIAITSILISLDLPLFALTPRRVWVIGIVTMSLYSLTVIQTLQTNARESQINLFENPPTQDLAVYDCLRHLPLRQDNTCLPIPLRYFATTERVAALALFDLNIFAENNPSLNVLPSPYQPGTPIITSTGSPWIALYLRDKRLAGVPAENIFSIYAYMENDPPLHYYQPPMGAMTQANNLESLTSFINHAEQVWYIANPSDPVSTSFFTTMDAQGYERIEYPLPIEQRGIFSFYKFQQRPAAADAQLSFGAEAISLLAWAVFPETKTLRSCEQITVTSWWTSEHLPAYNYSTTLVLIAPDGHPIAQQDAAIGNTLLQLWEPGKLYLDERILTVPCDAAPGDYQLAWGTYLNTGSGFEDLPAYDAAGNDLGTRAALTTVIIEGS